MLPQVQESVTDFGKFGSLCQLKAFTPFASAEDALANINDISEGIMNETLHTFLEMNLPKVMALTHKIYPLSFLAISHVQLTPTPS
jgi:nucleolar protein 56